MPDASVPALGRADSTLNGTPTSAHPSKGLSTTSSNTMQKSGKMAPRVDIETIYTELKRLVGDHWNTYKDAVARYMLGSLSHEELARSTDHFILLDHSRECLHNQLLCALQASILRDVPEAGVASWVSSNDKPTAVVKHVSGDVAEQRLRTEVMQLPPKVRARLKGINDDPPTPVISTLMVAQRTSRIQSTSNIPSLLPSTSNSVAPTANLNKDLDIRRRYLLPLASEAHDLPSPTSLAERITPICYEEGLPSGPANAESHIDLLSVGLETFVKEVLVSILDRTTTNAPVSRPLPSTPSGPAADVATANTSLSTGQPSSTIAPVQAVSQTGGTGGVTSGPRMGILTASYKRRLAREEAAYARGEVKRTEMGYLPCEVASMAEQRALDAASLGLNGLDEEEQADENLVGVPQDLRLAWEMGEQWLTGTVPWLGERLMGMEAGTGTPGGDLGLVNGVATHGISNQDAGAMDTGADGEADGEDEGTLPDWDWQGAGQADRSALGALLDDCLAVGQ